jgi:hypothetical protein
MGGTRICSGSVVDKVSFFSAEEEGAWTLRTCCTGPAQTDPTVD